VIPSAMISMAPCFGGGMSSQAGKVNWGRADDSHVGGDGLRRGWPAICFFVLVEGFFLLQFNRCIRGRLASARLGLPLLRGHSGNVLACCPEAGLGEKTVGVSCSKPQPSE